METKSEGRNVTQASNECPHYGFLEDIFAVFDTYQHPFILVESRAMNWMGIPFAAYPIEQAPRLERRVGTEGESDLCVVFWSETVYMLSVDGDTVQVPEALGYATFLLEERFHPNPIGDRDDLRPPARGRKGPQRAATYQARNKDRTTPMLIPTIPRFMDALSDQLRHYREKFPIHPARPAIHLSYFVRYLFLDTDAQQKKFYRELSERNRMDMHMLATKFKRKPKFGSRRHRPSHTVR
ncbi:MAG: hypothetical protein M1819_000432 [Sarea resinae]|nr:MAG: hypothetical protein M1819_000432 [Sarea resinae]